MSRTFLLATIAAAAVLGAALVAAQGQAPRPIPSRGAQAERPLPPLPNPGFAPARPMDITQQVYEFAGRFPEIVRHVPCYCGCEVNGHRSADGCFVRARDAQGHVTAWDLHGFG
jgi:hypothetical protein